LLPFLGRPIQDGRAGGMHGALVSYDGHKKEVGARGGAVVEAMRYKMEGRGIDFRCH
jgi:hypothetical protein